MGLLTLKTTKDADNGYVFDPGSKQFMPQRKGRKGASYFRLVHFKTKDTPAQLRGFSCGFPTAHHVLYLSMCITNYQDRAVLTICFQW